MRFVRSVVALALTAVLLTALAACGIPVESLPRDITDPRSSTTISSGGPSSIPLDAKARIFFFSSSLARPDRLQGVSRNAEVTVPSVVRELLNGLAKDEFSTLQSSIPADTQVLSAVLNADGTAEVNLNAAFFNAKGDQLLRAVAQLVYTAASVPNVKQVRILVAGESREWPKGDGTRLSRPLKTDDFAELSPSSQPDYVVAPSK